MKRRGRDSIPAVVSRLANKRQTGIVLAHLPADSDAFADLEFASKLIATACEDNPATLGIWVAGFEQEQQRSVVESMLAAALAAVFAVSGGYRTEYAPGRDPGS